MVYTTPRPRRFRRWAIRIGVVLVGLMALVWFAPAIVAHTGLKQYAIRKATADLNGSAEAGELSLGWLSPVELRNVRVNDARGTTLLTADRVSTSRTLLDLAWDRSDLGTITLEQPVVAVSCENGSTNLEQVISNYLNDQTPPRAERTAVALVVVDGRVTLNETGVEQTLDKVTGTVTVPKSRSEPIAVAIKAETVSAGQPGTLDVKLRYCTESELELTANDFATESVGPLVRRFAPGTVLGGRLTTKLTATWTADDAGRTKAVVEGVVQVAKLDLAAPWLGQDRVRLERAELPGKVTIEAGLIRVDRAKLTCDIGEATASGVYNPGDDLEQMLARPDVRLTADVDLAKLAAVVPKLLRLKEGTALQKGQVALQLASAASERGTVWNGSVRTTAVEGTRDGQKLVWDQPLRAEFAARMRPDGSPEFDKLECQSDFVGLAARGNAEQFVAAANINLDRLSARLADFIDLSGHKLEGMAAVAVKIDPRTGGGSTLTATAKLTRFAFTNPTGRDLREPELALAIYADWSKKPDGTIRVDAASATVTAAGDELQAKLLEPTADLRTGKADVLFTGDFAHWWSRLGAFVNLPRGYELGGTGRLHGAVFLTPDGATVEKATGTLANGRFRGAGLVIDERTFTAEANVAWSRKTGVVTLTKAAIASETAAATSDRIDFKPTTDSYGVAGRCVVTADANRLQRALQLQSDPAGSDAIHGLAKGTVAIEYADGPVNFDGDVVIERFALGTLAKPTWSEPTLKVVAKGNYDLITDGVRLDSAKVERPGLAVTTAGNVSRVTTSQDIDLTGTVAYDFAMLEPQVRDYLGKGGRVVGKDTQPYKIAGRLGDSKPPVAVTVSRPKAPSAGGSLLSLTGNAAVSWQSIRAHGFDVGPSVLHARLDRGFVTATPVEAAFGGGKVRLEPTLDLGSNDLSFARGRIVEKARLTPEVCANALGYAVPAFANAAKADGLVSLDLDENRVPLADPEKATVAGKLTLHTATVSPGPVVTQITTLLGITPPVLNLATEQAVPVRLDKGRVHHENFSITLGQSVVTTSGSVGLDGSLALVLDLPLPQRALESGLAKNPKIRDLLLKQRLKLPLAGTLSKPQLDPKAFEAAVETVLRTVAKDAAQSTADDLLKKGQDKLFEELQKKLLPPPKK